MKNNLIKPCGILIPYKCRCEALGENKRRGALYKNLTDTVNSDGIFTVKSSWSSKNVYLSVCGGKGDYCVKINGERVGSGTSPYTEFSVSKFIKYCQSNVISIDNAEGLDVYLTARPKTCVRNAFVRPVISISDEKIESSFNITFDFDGGNVPEGLFAELYDKDLRLLTKVKVEDGTASVPVENPVLWNAENPYVYRILLVTPEECLSVKAALREITVDNGFFEVNGKAVTLNHYLGENQTSENVNNIQMAKNMLTMLKRRGFNAISPSLFPYFKELSDVVKELGFYVLDVDSEIKNKTVVSPVDFKLVNGAGGLVRIENNYDYTTLGDFDINYRIVNQQETVSCGHMKAPDVKPGQSTVVKLGYSLPDLSFFEYFLEIDIVSNDVRSWHEQGFTIASKTLKLPVVQSEPETYYSSEMADICVRESDGTILISGTDGEDFVISFDKKTGLPSMIFKDGNDYIKELSANPCTGISISGNGGKYVSLTTSFESGAAFFVVYGDGEIGCSVIGDAGFSMKLPERFDRVAFFGNYPSGDVYDICLEDGKTEKLRYAVFYDEDDRGLMVKAVEPFDMISAGGKITFSSGEPAFSFVLRPIYLSEEDVMREGRTLPGIG